MNNPNNPQDDIQTAMSPEDADQQVVSETGQDEEQQLSDVDILDGLDQPADDEPQEQDLYDLALLDGAEPDELGETADTDIATELAALQAMDGLPSADISREELLTGPIEELVDTAADELIDEQSLTNKDWQGYTQEFLTPILEAAVFAHGKPLTLDRMLGLFDAEQLPSKKCLQYCLQQLALGYQGRGITLVEVKSGWRFQTMPQTGEYVQRLWDERPQKYTRATLETLALIAYRQPITRGEIEDVRGVSVSTQIIKTLQERDWIRVVGHRDVPGRPAMYATTREFLDYFGLKSLTELPSLSEIKDLDEINPELDLDAAGDDDETSDFDKAVNEMKNASAVSEEQSYIDQELSDELAAMDSVNMAFEQMLAAQRASLQEEQDQQEEEDSEDQSLSVVDELEQQISGFSDEDEAPAVPDVAHTDEILSEDEKIAIIQAKLAEQARLLAAADEPQEDDESQD